MSKTSFPLQPLFDRVIVRPEAQEQTTAGGIILTQAKSDTKIIRGTVIAVGKGRITDSGNILPLQVSVGDTVLLSASSYSNEEIEYEGVTYTLVKEDSLLAVVTTA